MKKFIRIGVDLGKNYFQVHALTSEDGQPRTRKLSRQAMGKFFSEIEPCLVGMEACASSHYWARELLAMGHDVRLIPPIYVKPYVKRGKNDAADAEAICEAMSRPGMRFVPVKSAESQATLMLHKTRELVVKQRTMSINALRSHLLEFGIVIAKGIGRVDELLDVAEQDATLPNAARAAAKVLAGQIAGLEKALDELEAEIAAAHEASEMSRLLIEVPGIGKLIATAIVANLPDPSVFKKGRDFAAWLGLTPRVLILDEPTRGVDVGAKSEIYALMDELAKSGMALLMISSDLEEILGMSDRVLVMHQSRLAGELSRAALSEHAIMQLATGGHASP